MNSVKQSRFTDLMKPELEKPPNLKPAIHTNPVQTKLFHAQVIEAAPYALTQLNVHCSPQGLGGIVIHEAPEAVLRERTIELPRAGVIDTGTAV
jgi:hypothetical protein